MTLRLVDVDRFVGQSCNFIIVLGAISIGFAIASAVTTSNVVVTLSLCGAVTTTALATQLVILSKCIF